MPLIKRYPNRKLYDTEAKQYITLDGIADQIRQLGGEHEMITINFVFWMFVIFFGIVGVFRGWAKELLVTFSVIVALTLSGLLYQYVPFVSALDPHSTTLMWVNVTILLVLVYFGYQSISFRRVSEKATRGEKLGDLILSFILGAFNAYLVFGSLWFYIAQAGEIPKEQGYYWAFREDGWTWDEDCKLTLAEIVEDFGYLSLRILGRDYTLPIKDYQGKEIRWMKIEEPELP